MKGAGLLMTLGAIAGLATAGPAMAQGSVAETLHAALRGEGAGGA